MQIQRWTAGILSAGALTVTVAGCAYGDVRQVLRTQVASELNCPDVKLERRGPDFMGYEANQFLVTGCGTKRTYTCPTDAGMVSYDEKACTFVEGDDGAPKGTATPKSLDDDPFAEQTGADGATSGGEVAGSLSIGESTEEPPAAVEEPEKAVKKGKKAPPWRSANTDEEPASE